MNGDLDISNYLNAVYQNWIESRGEFPRNIYLKNYWPIPFFGNPRTAIVATIGVNPSSGEFASWRNWAEVKSKKDWKLRLKTYFNYRVTPHLWFQPWFTVLAMLGISYEAGTATHFDVSYRPTRAMLRNDRTDPKEFRRMVERDVTWLFRLLPLCPKLQGLLVFGLLIRQNGPTESLAEFVLKSAPHYGFKILDSELQYSKTSRTFFVQEVQSFGRGSITEQVVENLGMHRDKLQDRIARHKKRLL